MNSKFSGDATDEGTPLLAPSSSAFLCYGAGALPDARCVWSCNFAFEKYNILCYILKRILMTRTPREGGGFYEWTGIAGCAAKKGMDASGDCGKARSYPGLSFHAGKRPPLDARCPGASGGRSSSCAPDGASAAPASSRDARGK